MTKYLLCSNFRCGGLISEGQDFCDNCDTPSHSFLHPLPNADQVQGTLIGKSLDETDVRIPMNLSGYAFYGMTGVGKTTLAMKTAVDASMHGITLLILDPEGEWKNIMPYLAGKTDYYALLHGLKINPFDIHEKGTIKTLLRQSVLRGKETEQDFWDLSPSMDLILSECIDRSSSIPELIDNVLNFDESTVHLASLEKSRTALLVRLLPYKNNEVLREIFYCDKSTLDLRRLDDRNIVIDLHPLAILVSYETELRLAYNVITIAALRQALGKPVTDSITNMLVADEAQMMVPRILQKILVTDTFASTNFIVLLRKRGMATMLCTQSPTNIEPDVVKNIAASVIGRLQSPDDAKLVAGLLGYSHYARIDHIAKILAGLKPKQAIVKTSLSIRPVMVNSVDVSFNQISDESLDRYIPKITFNYDNAEQIFLDNIKTHPFIPVVERRSMLGWDEKRYSEIVSHLIAKGVIEKKSARLGKGRPRVLYQLKNARPSVVHEFYVAHLISKLAEMGFVCRAEKIGPDIQILDSGMPNAKKIGINIELGSSDIIGGATRALTDFDLVVVASDEISVLDTVSSKIKAKNILCVLVWEVPALFEKMQIDND